MPKSLYPHLHRGGGYSDFGENLFYHTLKIKNAELVTLILHFLFLISKLRCHHLLKLTGIYGFMFEQALGQGH